jgi:hypothetical protein
MLHLIRSHPKCGFTSLIHLIFFFELLWFNRWLHNIQLINSWGTPEWGIAHCREPLQFGKLSGNGIICTFNWNHGFLSLHLGFIMNFIIDSSILCALAWFFSEITVTHPNKTPLAMHHVVNFAVSTDSYCIQHCINFEPHIGKSHQHTHDNL